MKIEECELSPQFVATSSYFRLMHFRTIHEVATTEDISGSISGISPI